MDDEAIPEAELVEQGSGKLSGMRQPIRGLNKVYGPWRSILPAWLDRQRAGDRRDRYRQTRAVLVVFLLILTALGLLISYLLGDSPFHDHDEQPFDPTLQPPVNNEMHVQPDNQNEMSVAYNPMDPLNIVAGANDYGCNALYEDAWAGFYTSFDGGTSWTGGCIPGYPGDSSTEGLQMRKYTGAGDPVVVADSNGKFYYAGIAFGRSPYWFNDIFVAVSDDGGRTFGDLEIVSADTGSGLGGFFHDKEWIHVDPFNNNIYLAWAMFQGATTSRIMFARSTNGGASWEPAYAISGWMDGQMAHQGTSIAVDGKGHVHVTWIDHSSNEIVQKTSTDSGATFQGPLTTAMPVVSITPIDRAGPPGKSYRTPNLPQMAGDHSGGEYDGTVYIVWSDARQDPADIMLGYTRDNGLSWDGPFKVNLDTPETQGTWQFFGSVTVTMTGEIWVMYYTSEYSDPAEDYLLDVKYAFSRDGGETFQAMRVTDRSFDGEAGGGSVIGENTGGDAFIGDYIEIDAGPEYVYGVWCDTRNGGTDPQQRDGDVYGAAVQWREL